MCLEQPIGEIVLVRAPLLICHDRPIYVFSPHWPRRLAAMLLSEEKQFQEKRIAVVIRDTTARAAVTIDEKRLQEKTRAAVIRETVTREEESSGYIIPA